jgi:hypothetical protein
MFTSATRTPPVVAGRRDADHCPVDRAIPELGESVSLDSGRDPDLGEDLGRFQRGLQEGTVEVRSGHGRVPPARQGRASATVTATTCVPPA